MRDLSSIATKDLTPADLSDPISCWTWAILYSAIHLALVATLHFQFFEVFSWQYYASFFLLVGLPFFLLPELYIRAIWSPYRREMMKRGGIPVPFNRHPPYDRTRRLISAYLFGSALLVFPAADRFVFFDVESRYWEYGLLLVVVGVPALFISIPLTLRVKRQTK